MSLSKLLAMGFVASHPDHDTYMEKIVKEFGAKASESLQFMTRHEDGPLNASATAQARAFEAVAARARTMG